MGIRTVLATNFDELDRYIAKKTKEFEAAATVQTQEETLNCLKVGSNIDAVVISDMLRGSMGQSDFIGRVVTLLRGTNAGIYYLSTGLNNTLKKFLDENGIRYFMQGGQITIDAFLAIIVQEYEEKKRVKEREEQVKEEIPPRMEKERDFFPLQKGGCTINRIVCILSAPDVHPGKSTVASNLAWVCSCSGRTALVDLSGDSNYLYDICPEKIKIKYSGMPGYNCLDTLSNAMEEDKVENIPGLAYAANPNLSVFTRKAGKKINGIHKFIDLLRTVYSYIIIDTKENDATNVEALTIADTVLFVQDASLAVVLKSLDYLEKIKSTTNIKKFRLVLNHYEENGVIDIDDMLKSHKERGIDFERAFIVPAADRACLEAPYLRKHAVELNSTGEGFKEAFHVLHTGVFSGAQQGRKFRVWGRLFK